MKEESKLVTCGECASQGQVGAGCSEEGGLLGTLKRQPREKEKTGEMKLAAAVR